MASHDPSPKVVVTKNAFLKVNPDRYRSLYGEFMSSVHADARYLHAGRLHRGGCEGGHRDEDGMRFNDGFTVYGETLPGGVNIADAPLYIRYTNATAPGLFAEFGVLGTADKRSLMQNSPAGMRDAAFAWRAGVNRVRLEDGEEFSVVDPARYNSLYGKFMSSVQADARYKYDGTFHSGACEMGYTDDDGTRFDDGFTVYGETLPPDGVNITDAPLYIRRTNPVQVAQSGYDDAYPHPNPTPVRNPTVAELVQQHMSQKIYPMRDAAAHPRSGGKK